MRERKRELRTTTLLKIKECIPLFAWWWSLDTRDFSASVQVFWTQAQHCPFRPLYLKNRKVDSHGNRWQQYPFTLKLTETDVFFSVFIFYFANGFLYIFHQFSTPSLYHIFIRTEGVYFCRVLCVTALPLTFIISGLRGVLLEIGYFMCAV